MFYNTKKILSKSKYLSLKKDKELFDEIENINELQEKEILDFLEYNTNDYNDFTKYKL